MREGKATSSMERAQGPPGKVVAEPNPTLPHPLDLSGGPYSDDDPVGLAKGAGFALRLHLQVRLPVEEDEKQPRRQHGARVAQSHPPRPGLVARDLLEERRSPLRGR